MIQIKKNKKNADQFTLQIITSKGNYVSVKKKLENWLAVKSGTDPNRGVINYLHSNISRIISSEPKELEKVITEFQSKGYQTRILNSRTGKLKPLGKEIKIIFNYEGFRDSNKAVLFAKQLNIKSCTYCNTQYTLTVEHNKKTKLLFHLDHFFPKSIYPYLNLSYYNLIPCCASCNMSKSDMPYKLDENIHPYIDNLDKIAKYEAEKNSLVKYLLNVNKNENEIKLQLNIRPKYFGDAKIEKKLDNYKNEFKVESQYQQFKDVVGETYLKGLYYNKYRKKELTDFFKKNKSIVLTDEMINRFIIGNYTEEKDLLRRPLAKMMKDISEDFDLI